MSTTVDRAVAAKAQANVDLHSRYPAVRTAGLKRGNVFPNVPTDPVPMPEWTDEYLSAFDSLLSGDSSALEVLPSLRPRTASEQGWRVITEEERVAFGYGPAPGIKPVENWPTGEPVS